MLSVDPLNVHLTNISLILVTQLIHASDKIVPLIGQIGELVIQGQLVLSVLDLVASAVLKLTLQVSNTPTCRVVVRLQPLQIIGFADQI